MPSSNDLNDTLFYDPHCPVCLSFSKLLEKKVTQPGLILSPLSKEEASQVKDFFVESPQGKYEGKEAVDYLAQKYPEIKDFFWMLPASYRHSAVQGSFKIARWIRKWILGKKDCNCD